jgi:hypothetical protein
MNWHHCLTTSTPHDEVRARLPNLDTTGKSKDSSELSCSHYISLSL